VIGIKYKNGLHQNHLIRNVIKYSGENTFIEFNTGDRVSKRAIRGIWGAKEQMKGFAVRVMDAYTQNFHRNDIDSDEELV